VGRDLLTVARSGVGDGRLGVMEELPPMGSCLLPRLVEELILLLVVEELDLVFWVVDVFLAVVELEEAISSFFYELV